MLNAGVAGAEGVGIGIAGAGAGAPVGGNPASPGLAGRVSGALPNPSCTTWDVSFLALINSGTGELRARFVQAGAG